MSFTDDNPADDNTISSINSDLNIIKDTLTKDATNAIKWFKENIMKANPKNSK